MTEATLEPRICDFVDSNRERLVQLVRELVRIPSENTPPTGNERQCQEYIADVLRASGWATELYELTDVEGLEEHPLFWGARHYGGRPNLGARRTRLPLPR